MNDCRSYQLPTDVIRKGTPDAIKHTARLILGVPKISTHSLSDTVQRSVFLAILLVRVFVSRVARHFALGLDIGHRRAGEHSFGAGNISAIRANVDRANRPTVYCMKGHDPNRVAVLVGAQGIARSVEAGPRFFGNMTGHLESAARIEIQSRSVDGRAFA